MHGHRDRGELRRHARRERGRARLHRAAQLPSLPRLKNIGSIRLYRPDDTPPGWPALGASLTTRAIKWDLIAQQYDQMVNTPPLCAWAPRRPNRSCAVSPAAVPNTHLRRARRLVSSDLRGEIHGGLQVVENGNSANTVLHYRKDARSPARTRCAPRPQCSLCTCSSPLSCTSTRCCFSRSSPNRPGP
ncbi:Tn3 family transposase [Streptomyces hygroscopicus]|uniref:Tn3 family transposase n=1 Tax=Streptomyces hygroscopicus TaxID=1912 RepID=UPI00363FA9A8